MTETPGHRPTMPERGAGPVAGRPDPSARRLGFPAIHVGGLTRLADDPEAVVDAARANATRFHGAFVPLVIHEPVLAERSYDAGEWAAELISAAGGRLLVVAPYAEAGWIASGMTPSVRQWNHGTAMIERLDGVCERFGVRAVIRDTVAGVELSADDSVPADEPVSHLIDTGRFETDGYAPIELICPEPVMAGRPPDHPGGPDRP